MGAERENKDCLGCRLTSGFGAVSKLSHTLTILLKVHSRLDWRWRVRSASVKQDENALGKAGYASYKHR